MVCVCTQDGQSSSGLIARRYQWCQLHSSVYLSGVAQPHGTSDFTQLFRRSGYYQPRDTVKAHLVAGIAQLYFTPMSQCNQYKAHVVIYNPGSYCSCRLSAQPAVRTGSPAGSINFLSFCNPECKALLSKALCCTGTTNSIPALNCR